MLLPSHPQDARWKADDTGLAVEGKGIHTSNQMCTCWMDVHCRIACTRRQAKQLLLLALIMSSPYKRFLWPTQLL